MIEELIECIKKDKLIQKYIYQYVWLSGSSTYVTPITIWKNEIIIQLDYDKNIWNKLIERYKKSFSIIDYIYFCKSDGSCPSSLIFKIIR